MNRTEAECAVYEQARTSREQGRKGPSAVRCPICDYAGVGGRILHGNFNGVRDTRIAPVIKHLRAEHFKVDGQLVEEMPAASSEVQS